MEAVSLATTCVMQFSSIKHLQQIAREDLGGCDLEQCEQQCVALTIVLCGLFLHCRRMNEVSQALESRRTQGLIDSSTRFWWSAPAAKPNTPK